MSMMIDRLCSPFRKARSVNQTSGTAVAKIAKNAEPSGDAATATGASIIELSRAGLTNYAGALIVPYGTGSADNTFSIRVIGWKVIGNNPLTRLWIPVNLCEVQVTLSTAVGVAACEVVATERFVDTLALVSTSGNPNVSMEMISPADNTIAHFSVGLKGFQKVELSFWTGSSATDCNALISLH